MYSSKTKKLKTANEIIVVMAENRGSLNEVLSASSKFCQQLLSKQFSGIVYIKKTAYCAYIYKIPNTAPCELLLHSAALGSNLWGLLRR
jgi:hypothetical protein